MGPSGQNPSPEPESKKSAVVGLLRPLCPSRRTDSGEALAEGVELESNILRVKERTRKYRSESDHMEDGTRPPRRTCHLGDVRSLEASGREVTEPCASESDPEPT